VDDDAQPVRGTGEHRHGGGGATGRSRADAPEIDGEVQLRDAGHLAQGDTVPELIEDADEHDLFGVPA
jgi:ribosomal protein S12 methylthiotransferase